MNQPVINIQLRRHEIEIKLGSFDEPDRDAFLQRIKKLDFGAQSPGKMLVVYGDPAKSSTYRYGIQLPKHIDAQEFTTRFVEQMRTIQFDDLVSFEVNHLPNYEPIGA